MKLSIWVIYYLISRPESSCFSFLPKDKQSCCWKVKAQSADLKIDNLNPESNLGVYQCPSILGEYRTIEFDTDYINPDADR